MTRDEFLKAVAERAGVSRDEADTLTRATLSTPADRLTGGEADDVAAQLPTGLKEAMIPSRLDAERFDVEEFLDRVAERAGVSPQEASAGVRAVLTTLREAITAGEFDDMMAQLPEEYAELLD